MYEKESGVYTATLAPGEYIINAEANNFKDLSEYFEMTKGECNKAFTMEKKAPTHLVMTANDIITARSIPGTLVKLSTLARGMNVENMTREEGKVEYKTEGRGYYKLAVSRGNYVPYTKELCVSKTSSTEITIPLIPLFLLCFLFSLFFARISKWRLILGVDWNEVST